MNAKKVLSDTNKLKCNLYSFENKDVKIYDKAGNIPLSLSQ